MNKPERNSHIVRVAFYTILVAIGMYLTVLVLGYVLNQMHEAYCRANLDGQYLNACLEKGVWSDE